MCANSLPLIGLAPASAMRYMHVMLPSLSDSPGSTATVLGTSPQPRHDVKHVC